MGKPAASTARAKDATNGWQNQTRRNECRSPCSTALWGVRSAGLTPLYAAGRRASAPLRPSPPAHKLARIIWHLIKYQEPYDPGVWAKAEEKNRQKKIKRLEKNAATLGFQLVSAP